MRGGISGRPERDASPQQRAVDHRLRRAILDAAIEELQMWSFERFSVETVADRAAVDRHVVHRLWNSAEQLMVDALVDHCDQVVIVPDTGSVRSDLAGHLASLAEYFNTGIGRSLLRTGVIGSTNWAPTRVRTYFWKARVDAVRIIFERAERRNEIRGGIDHNTANDDTGQHDCRQRSKRQAVSDAQRRLNRTGGRPALVADETVIASACHDS